MGTSYLFGSIKSRTFRCATGVEPQGACSLVVNKVEVLNWVVQFNNSRSVEVHSLVVQFNNNNSVEVHSQAQCSRLVHSLEVQYNNSNSVEVHNMVVQLNKQMHGQEQG